MLKNKLIVVFLINLALAAAFFQSNKSLSVNHLSSDLANIIPICKKIDNPNLYQNDVYLHDLENVKYYTPFFVETLRFIAKFTNADYMLAINILAFITHLLYGLIWFAFFYSLKKDFWLALLFSLFMRGLIWAPGMEILGISDLWTIMPRTLYVALLPIPFLLFVYSNKANLVLAAFAAGLILNFHPISGVGGIIIYYTLYIAFEFFNKKYKDVSFYKSIFYAGIFTLIGMLPFVLTYFLNTNSEVEVNPLDFEKAFIKRIPSYFLNPIEFIKTWNRPVTYVFGIGFLMLYLFDTSNKKKHFKILLAAIILVFFTANVSFYVEQFINFYFDKHLRMSFQLMRFQKFVIVLFQIGLFLLSVEVLKKNQYDSLKKIIVTLFVFTLFISRLTFFDNVPFIGDDFLRRILPVYINPLDNEIPKSDYAKMVDYIKLNTDENAVFYGKASFFIRAGADRSVVLDGKGAGMLIEGNPPEFVQWYKDLSYFNSCNEEDKLIFLKKKKVDYIISKEFNEGLLLEKKIGRYYLYKL